MLDLSWKFLSVIGAALFAGLAYWTLEPVFLDSDSSNSPEPSAPQVAFTATPGPNDPILIGAGDMATCEDDNDEETAKLLDAAFSSGAPGAVFTAGDNLHGDVTYEQFTACYGPTWGRHKEKTRPAPGNHEYHVDGGAGYFAYFGEASGEPSKGYYSFDLAYWHIVVLNTNADCSIISCAAGSEMEGWLREDLAAHASFCTAAIWHAPMYKSGRGRENTRFLRPLWEALYEYGAEVVINSHQHNYERFAPQTPYGSLDSESGIRQFIVGTGGRSHEQVNEPPLPNSEALNTDTHGVLKLTLHPASYDWEFIPEAGAAFTDVGSGGCHPAPP